MRFWLLPALVGIITMSLVWVVWYLTRVPCDPATAVVNQCNPGVIARYINAGILTQCLTMGSITATLTGGIDVLMFAQERRERIAAQQREQEQRQLREEERQQAEQRIEEERRRADQRIAEMMGELREGRQLLQNVLDRLPGPEQPDTSRSDDSDAVAGK